MSLFLLLEYAIQKLGQKKYKERPASRQKIKFENRFIKNLRYLCKLDTIKDVPEDGAGYPEWVGGDIELFMQFQSDYVLLP